MLTANGIRTNDSLPHGGCLMVAFGLTLLSARLRLRTSFQRRVGRYGNATAITREKSPFRLQLLA